MTASRRALIIVAVLIGVALGLPWGGAVPTASAQTIQVTAADPPYGEQGALNLNVLIKGKGFRNGAKAKFYRTGTADPDGINVKSTKYVSSTQLLATIDIADTAALAGFDIVVQNTDGRTGKGTELFKVTEESIDGCTLLDPVPERDPNTSDLPGLPGSLDSTFGTNGTGKVIGPRYMDVRGWGLAGRRVATDSLGRIVTIGTRLDHCTQQTNYEWMVARYLSSGDLDPSFGTGGVATTTFARSAYAMGVVVQPDDKIVVVGHAPSKIRGTGAAVARFNTNGSLDQGFGSGGLAWVSPGTDFMSVALQSDGRIVAVGEYQSTEGFVGRLTPSGAVDTTFNNGLGYYKYPSAPYPAVQDFNAVSIQTVEGEERIVVAGWMRDALYHYVSAVLRFTSAGAPDNDFGASGVVTTSFYQEDGSSKEQAFLDVTVDSSNRIVATGYASPVSGQAQLALARYDVSGQLDSLFGVGGKVLELSGQPSAIANAIGIQADGAIVVAGYTDTRAGLWRFTERGDLDASFGPSGSGWVQEANPSFWRGVLVQTDGKIVCVGNFATGTQPSVVVYAALWRYWQ
jgi:uncharacterized delta-60 repeat protein